MCNPPCRDLMSTGSKTIKGSVLVDLSINLTNWVFVCLCSVLGAHLIFLALRVWVLMFCVVLVRLTVVCVLSLVLIELGMSICVWFLVGVSRLCDIVLSCVTVFDTTDWVLRVLSNSSRRLKKSGGIS